MRGGCRCGSVRYELTVASTPPIYCCHCLDCQSWSGSAFSEQAIVQDGQIAMMGTITEFEVTNASGSTSRHRICPTCHTRLWNTNSARPGFAVVRAGTFDDSNTLMPNVHIWASRKQGWVVLPDGAQCWPEAAPANEFLALVGPAQ